MNPLVGVPPSQVNLNDPNISDYDKFEAAKNELAFCLSMIEINKDDVQGTEEKQKRVTDLYSYLQTKQKENKACYIATMAYGYYDHPKVVTLRQFRDNHLIKHRMGRWFIDKYYRYSPKLVKQLAGKKRVNQFIRKVLDQIIKLID